MMLGKVSVRHTFQACLPTHTMMAVAIGPLAGLGIWLLPLQLEPKVHKAFAIVGFMLIYWIAQPIDLGMTALMGCFLFWVLQVTSSAVAFSGFANLSPWFIFAALLMGQAASRTGLAKRLGALTLHKVGTSYTWLLLGLITLMFGLGFLMPAANAQIATLAPLVIGIITTLRLDPRSNVAKGLFLILTYTSTIFSKMFIGGGNSILTQGIIAEQTGVQVLWSQWCLAFLPVAMLTIVSYWLIIRWLYPAEHDELAGGQQYLQETLHTMGPWSRDERKALLWLLLATALWATDFLHHLSPAAIAIGIGLLLALPKVGLLDTKAISSVNFLLILFVAGAISMGNVLTHTKAMNILTDHLGSWMTPLLSNAWRATPTLYWGGFLYHFLIGSEFTMISTLLPGLLHVADIQGYNPVAVGMLWTFAGGGKLFLYQNTALILGYSYGYFTVKDLLKVGIVLTLVQGLFTMVLVPVYWPLIGLPWQVAPARQGMAPAGHDEVGAVLRSRGSSEGGSGAALMQQAQACWQQGGDEPVHIGDQPAPQTTAASYQYQATHSLAHTWAELTSQAGHVRLPHRECSGFQEFVGNETGLCAVHAVRQSTRHPPLLPAPEEWLVAPLRPNATIPCHVPPGGTQVEPWRWVSHPEPHHLGSRRPLEFFTHHGGDNHLSIQESKYRNLLDEHQIMEG